STIAGSGGGVSISSEPSGSVSFGSGMNITTSGPVSLSVSNSSANITYSGIITQSTAGTKLLNIDTYSTGTLTMNGISLSTSGAVGGLGGVISTLNNITGTVSI